MPAKKEGKWREKLPSQGEKTGARTLRMPRSDQPGAAVGRAHPKGIMKGIMAKFGYYPKEADLGLGHPYVGAGLCGLLRILTFYAVG
jgi:hypothetical protein